MKVWIFHARLGVNRCVEAASWHSIQDSLLLDARTLPRVLDSQPRKERSDALKIGCSEKPGPARDLILGAS